MKSLLEDSVSLLIVFYEEIELDLSPREGLAGIDGRQGEERTCGICMAESELAGPRGWRSLELHTTAWFLFILVSVLHNADGIEALGVCPLKRLCAEMCSLSIYS